MSHGSNGHVRYQVPDGGRDGPVRFVSAARLSGRGVSSGHVRNLVPDVSRGDG
jgi:hypothetical protein